MITVNLLTRALVLKLRQRACSKRYFATPEGRARMREAQQRYAKTPKGKQARRKERATYYARNRERLLEAARVQHHGVAREDAEARLVAQGGMCAICSKNISFVHGTRSGGACTDHDHITGRFRGVLCSRCNSAIAALGDDVVGLRRAATYLEDIK